MRYLYRERRARKCDAGIDIGRSLFIERYNRNKSAAYFQQMQRNKAAFFVMGANFGSYKEEEFKQTYDQLFMQYTDICFRDKSSKSLFPNSSHIRYRRDIVFELDTPNTLKLESTVVNATRFHVMLHTAVYQKKSSQSLTAIN